MKDKMNKKRGKGVINRVKSMLSVIAKWDSKFKAKVILAIGFLFVGYLYALGHRYQTIQTSKIQSFGKKSPFYESVKKERISINYEYILDAWTGKIYNNYGLEFSKLQKKKKKNE